MKKLTGVVLTSLFAVGMIAAPFASAKEDKEEGAKKKPDPAAAFARLDKDSDGKLSKEEFVGKRTDEAATKAGEMFAKKDKDSDGSLSKEEFTAGPKGKGKPDGDKPKKKKKDADK
jgi:Ca2+-binding EF-hand superfamily protein